jgi:hypothetical protein
MKYNFDPSELTKEKSLWDIYVLSLRIKSSRFNKITIIFSTVFLFYYTFMLHNNNILLSEIRSLSLFALNLSITVLGFLIAGFTIFATLSKPDMLLKMMEHIHKETGLPFLKYNFIAFVRVFIYYIAIIFFYIFIILLGNKNGLISITLNYLPMAPLIKDIIIKFSYIAVGSSLIYLVLLLKTFIFNIYSIVMNQLRWECFISKDNDTN